MKQGSHSSLKAVPSIGQQPLTILLAGATGLVGSRCLELLLDSPRVKKVVAPTRRTLPNPSNKLRNVLVDFDRLDEYPELFQCDVIICCMGTTIKQAGSKTAFQRVDYQYCSDLAELGRSYTAKAFYLVSAVGANSRSLLFYNRVKGLLEKRLKQLEYDYLSIYRPSLLIGDRDERRPGESVGIKVARLVNPFLTGSMAQYKAIESDMVARAIVNEVTQIGIPENCQSFVNIHTHNEIMTMAHKPESISVPHRTRTSIC